MFIIEVKYGKKFIKVKFKNYMHKHDRYIFDVSFKVMK
jgi:hypothetical protein